MAELIFTAVGDCIISRRYSVHGGPEFTELVELIRSADVAHANLEVVTPRYPWIGSSEYGGMHLGVPEHVLDELAGMGFNLYCVANNHAGDYTYAGLVDTLEALESRGMTYAGGGRNLGEARSPGYLETKAGRTAIVAFASSFTTGSHAAAARPDMPGRPGINPLRIDRSYVLDEKRLAALAEIDEALGTAEVSRRRRRFDLFPSEWKEGAIKFLGADFFSGDKPQVRQIPKEQDLEDIHKWIRDARRQADFVVASWHVHMGPAGDSNCPEIAEFIPDVMRRLVDSGADAVVGHGPHQLRPIEVYRGKPLFYSLGNFFYAIEGIPRYPAEMYERHKFGADATPADVVDVWERGADGKWHAFHGHPPMWQSVLPICRFDGGQLVKMELHPVVLGLSDQRARRGEPRLACGAEGRAILERLAEVSRPHGTGIDVIERGDRVVGNVTWAGSSAI
ncbi:MAG: CapA family protein [Bacillota bacterium]|nr:CapA family protein [Bacillota bacterium]